MTTAKKRTTVWIDPHVIRKLKHLGVEHGQPFGNVLEALADFSEMGKFITDPNFRKLFDAMLQTAFANAGGRATWEGSAPGDEFDGGQGPSGDDLEEV